MSEETPQPVDSMRPEDRQKGWQMVRHGCFSWLFIGFLHAVVWGALTLPLFSQQDMVGLVIVGGIVGMVGLGTAPFFLAFYVRFFFGTRSHILVDLFGGKVTVLRGQVEKTWFRGHSPLHPVTHFIYGHRLLTVDGIEYDTGLFPQLEPEVGQWVELRFGQRTGILCGVVEVDGPG